MQGRGDILRIDLSTRSVSREPVSPELCHRFLGGEGLNSWLLWEHFLKVSPRIDPLSADNVLIAGVGPLGGTGYGAGTKMKWTFKSPITNMFGDSASGGFFPGHLRWAGYEHVVITGKAKQPVYIWIDNDSVEIRDASHLWGKNVDEADSLIKEELGDRDIETACIGRAGENLVVFSTITVSRSRAAGRTGGGCVMGSKNLKAIAVRGSAGVDVYDPEGFVEAIDTLHKALRQGSGLYAEKEQGEVQKRFGTLVLPSAGQRMGIHPFRNAQSSQLPLAKMEKLHHQWYTQNLGQGPLSCSAGCINGCSGWYRVKGDESSAAGRYVTTRGHKPENSPVINFGVQCDIPDLTVVGHCNEMCNRYSLDVKETGTICGFLMELWQRGVITEKDTTEWFGEPVSLEWGNYEAVEKIIDSIALQNNKLGLLIKDGVYKAAHRIEEMKGAPVLKYALYGKGGISTTTDFRHYISSALNFAVASRGGDHLKAMGTLDKVNRPDISMLYFGTPDAAKPFNITLKGASSVVQENRCAVINCLGLCVLVLAMDSALYPLEMFSKALLAATGVAMTPEELWAVGERTVNLEKAFNSRLGYRREDDTLCERWLKEPAPDGPGKGWKADDYLEQAKAEYYEHHGWDKQTSLQTDKKLKELGLNDVARVLKKEKALV